MTSIRVSVIVPTYNRSSLLRQALDSCQAQSLGEVQIVVADDGSTDDTAETVECLAPRVEYPVEYLGLPHSGLPAVARNRALEHARGEFVAFLDSDDLFLADKLERQAVALAEHPQVALVYSNGVFFTEDPEEPTGHVLDGLPTPSGNALPDLLRGNFLFPSTVMVRRAAIEKAGGFEESKKIRGAEDYDLWLRLAATSEVAFVPGDVAGIRRHEGSLSADTAAIRLAAIEALGNFVEAYPELAKRYAFELHEGFARNHAAVAAAKLGVGDLTAVSNLLGCVAHSLRAPHKVGPAFIHWTRTRNLRHAAQPPRSSGGE